MMIRRAFLNSSENSRLIHLQIPELQMFKLLKISIHLHGVAMLHVGREVVNAHQSIFLCSLVLAIVNTKCLPLLVVYRHENHIMSANLRNRLRPECYMKTT